MKSSRKGNAVINNQNDVQKSLAEGFQGIQVFENSEFGKIRTILIDGNPWFVGNEVARILGYSNTRDAISKHVDERDKNTVVIRDGIMGNPNKIIISESGLYSLIFSSKLPNAKKFTYWVTSEVLPSIHKHGLYATDELLNDPDLAIKAFTAIKVEREKNKVLEAEKKLLQAENAELAPKAEYHDAVLNKKGLIHISTIAKDIGLRSGVALNKIMNNNKIIYRDSSGVWKPYAEYEWLIKDGYADYHSYSNPDAALLLKWTEKGRQWIIDNFASNVEKEASKGERGAV